MPATSPNFWKRLPILVICFGSIVLFPSAGGTTTSSNQIQNKRLTQDIQKSIKRYELVKLDPAALAAQVHRTGKLSFQTSGERYDLDLVPHDMRAPNYRAEEVGTDGKLHAVKSGPVTTFKGTVRGIEGAQARFTVNEKRIEGLIVKPNGRYFIEPARKYSSSATSYDYILYNSLDVDESSELGCGVTLSQAVTDRAEKIESTVPKRNESLTASQLRVVELATEADYEYVNEFGGSTQANDQILSVMNQVDGIFNTDVAIGFTIVYQHTWATPDDPYSSTSAVGSLNEFTSYWNANMGSVSRDLAHMFTYRDFNDFGGVAWIGVVCNSPSTSYALSRNRPYRMASLVAHEIGHNFSAAHVDNTSSCENSIMRSDVGFGTTFCEFSRNQILNHAASNPACLSSTPGCDYVLSATGQTFSKDAGAGTVNVTAGLGCNWLATSNVAWISIAGVGNPDSPGYFTGNGSASIDYTIQANSGYTRRGIISIAGQDFTVTQAGIFPDCIVTPLLPNQPNNGTLSPTDCASSWRFYFAYTDVYSFNGAAGQQIRLSMNAPTFVPYLYLTGPDGALVGASNSNGGPNDAYIPSSSSMLTLPKTGLYTVEATSWANEVTGAYTLEWVSTPMVVTTPASSVSTSGAQLNGTTNANSFATNAWFEWGTNSSLSIFNSTPQQSVGSGNADVSVNANLSGLTSDTIYYYRLVAANTNGVAKGSILSFATGSTNVQVIVQTSPSNLSFTVDQTTYTSTQTFTWVTGSSHTISTTSPQSGTTGTQYVWSNWSDGGAISHTVSPATNTTFTANFATQHFLTMSSGTCGSLSPESNWYNSGQAVQITATPNIGCAFTGWTGSGSGSYTGTDNPAAVTMSGPITETANFAPAPILLTEENSNRAIAFDSVTLMRDPFPVTTLNNFSLDGRSRIMLLATNFELLPGNNVSVVTAQAEDSQHTVFPLTVEYVGKVPAFDWLLQINVKLPDALANAGDVLVSISFQGQPSNKVLVRIRPSQ